jgi:predicted RNA-binding Zn ribbon-like protein
MFIGDAIGLDFLNSVAAPVDTRVEWIGSGAGLIDWLRQSGLVQESTLQKIARSAGPGELDAVAAQARALREWFREFVQAHMGTTLTRASVRELAPLNRLLARDELFGQIVADGNDASGPELRFVDDRRWRSPESLLMPIARAMAELVTSTDFTHVKACEGNTCTLLFKDTTRGRKRRWCSMAVCGNRAKQAAHRERSAHAK